MSNIKAGKPYNYKGTTITPLQPVPEDKGEEIVDIEKRDKHVVITFPASTQQRLEAEIFSCLPMKPSLSPFRFRGRVCCFIDNAGFYNEDMEKVDLPDNGFHRGRIHLQIPSINQKDGDTYLKIKLMSVILCK